MGLPWKFQLAFWSLEKVATASTIYSLVLSFKEDSSEFVYTFLSFYIGEVIFRLIATFLYLRPRILDSIILIILSPAQLQELYYLFFYFRFDHNIFNNDLFEFSFVKSLSSIPQYAMVLIKLLNSTSPALIEMLLGSLVLLLLTITLVSIVSFTLFEEDQTLTNFSSKEIIGHAKEGLIACLHFITYAALLYANFTLVNNFYISLIIVYSILAISFLMSIIVLEKNRVYFLFFSNSGLFFYSLGFLIKQTLHVDFDQRKVQSNQYPYSMKRYSIKLFDNMIAFSMILKFYLLIMLFLRVIIGEPIEQKNSKVGVIVLLAFSIMSFFIYAIRFIGYVILPFFKGPEQIEITSLNQLVSLIEMSKLSKQKFNHPQHKQLRNLKRIFGEKPDDQHEHLYLKLVVDSVLSSFEGVQIQFGETFIRKKQANQSQFFEVKIESRKSIDQIVDKLAQDSLLPNIGKLVLNQPPKLLIPLVKILFSNNKLILIENKYESSILEDERMQKNYELLNYNSYVSEVRLTCLNAITFNQQISFTQRVNPLAIYYDLHDS